MYRALLIALVSTLLIRTLRLSSLSLSFPEVEPLESISNYLPASSSLTMGGGDGYKAVAYFVNWAIYGRAYEERFNCGFSSTLISLQP